MFRITLRIRNKGIHKTEAKEIKNKVHLFNCKNFKIFLLIIIKILDRTINDVILKNNNLKNEDHFLYFYMLLYR